MKLISQGAEAKIYEENKQIVKSRTTKSYRLPEIDDKLRKFRTRRETKILEKLTALNFPSPKVISSTDKEMKITMEKIPGEKLRDVLNKENCKAYGKEMGEKIAVLHDNEIVHGDLTTSNMIFNDEIHFIDFGLSFFSNKNEDYAVDLHVLHQILESYHNELWEDCFKAVLEGYKKKKSASQVLKRLEQVEKRGRYKH